MCTQAISHFKDNPKLDLPTKYQTDHLMHAWMANLFSKIKMSIIKHVVEERKFQTGKNFALSSLQRK